MRALTVFVLFALVAGSAWAGDPRLEARLDPAALTAVGDILDLARHEGIPIEPLVQKALEGHIKGASGERIAAATYALLGRLRTAREVFGVETADAELTAAAAALYAGVDTTTLVAIHAVAREHARTVELVVLADLIERGIPIDEASAMILSLVRARVDQRQILELRDRVERDIRDGVSPRSAAQTRVRGLLDDVPTGAAP